MSITKAQLRARALQRADATGSTRWDTTANAEVDNIASGVFDAEWKNILTHAPATRLASRTPTSSASTGRYAISDLSSGSGDTAQRFFRIRAFVIDQIPYQEVKFEDYSTGEALGLSIRVYWREGDSIMTLPKQFSKQADAVWVSHLPTRPDALSADSVAVTFPDGHEEVLILQTAAELLMKGGAESQAAAELAALAEIKRAAMIAELTRFSGDPMRMRYEDLAADWGG